MAFTTRPTLRGYGGAVSSGHYLATQIGAQMLAEGGNAADAACAMGFALHLLEPHMNGPAGEVPILFYEAATDRVHAISGQGPAPAAASIEHFEALGMDRIPGSGLLAATVPAAIDAWCQLLEHFGTRRFADVSAPAQALALRGVPLDPFLRGTLTHLEEKFSEVWPTSGALYCPKGAAGALGSRLQNPAYGSLLDELAHAEKSAGGTREHGVRAARDTFYCGRAAEVIDRFLREPAADDQAREHEGLLRADDMASYRGEIETPLCAEFRGASVYKCAPWSQGPVFLQQLRLLDGFDLGGLAKFEASALHTLIECAKLAFADREACYGDPRFVDVPLDTLLSEEYTESRRSLVDPTRASDEIRPGLGALPAGWPWIGKTQVSAEPQAAVAARGRGDTTHLDACDCEGNLVAATPSGAWIQSSPVIPDLGFPIGTRAQMFCLDPAHPNALQPGKRPRTTLTPSQARFSDGRRMAFGTPGGDQQDQWTLQFFLRTLLSPDDDLQAAIDAPTLDIHHMPSSFYPRTAEPGVVAVESRVPEAAQRALQALGHRLIRAGAWEHGRVMAVTRDPESGLCEAAASPRSQVAYAIALP